MSGPHDQSGNKNAIQAIASTVTYLERHTAVAITGVAVSDEEDDDGAGGASGGVAQPARRTAAQWEEREASKDTRPPQPVAQPARRASAAEPSEPPPQTGPAPGPVTISAQAIKLLRSKLTAAGRAEADCCAHFGVAEIGALPMARVNEALKWAAA
jgi:hypothetical protein